MKKAKIELCVGGEYANVTITGFVLAKDDKSIKSTEIQDALDILLRGVPQSGLSSLDNEIAAAKNYRSED